jgi:hypothetical protein
MKVHYLAALLIAGTMAASVNLAVPTLLMAQSAQKKDDMEQLAMDLHVGIDRSTLTPGQKDQLRDDFRELRRAHQNHEMFATMRAARSIRGYLDSGAFKPEDQHRIKEDIQQIKEAREER